MIEYSNILHSEKNSQIVAWHTRNNKPLDGYIHVLTELRYRTTGDLAERAWRQIAECFNHSLYLRSLHDYQRHSALFVALSNLAVKAWEARAEALRQSQPFMSPPEVILQMQDYLDSWRLKNLEINAEHVLMGSRDVGSGEAQLAKENLDSYENTMEVANSVNNSTLTSLLPVDDPMDWVY